MFSVLDDSLLFWIMDSGRRVSFESMECIKVFLDFYADNLMLDLEGQLFVVRRERDDCRLSGSHLVS